MVSFTSLFGIRNEKRPPGSVGFVVYDPKDVVKKFVQFGICIASIVRHVLLCGFVKFQTIWTIIDEDMQRYVRCQWPILTNVQCGLITRFNKKSSKRQIGIATMMRLDQLDQTEKTGIDEDDAMSARDELS